MLVVSEGLTWGCMQALAVWEESIFGRVLPLPRPW